MARIILGVIIGWIAGSAFNMAVVILSQVIYPLPPGVKMDDTAAMDAYIQTLPAPAFVLVLIAHAGGAFAGGLVAALIARRSQVVLGGIIGGLFLLGGAYMAMMMAAPLWFEIVDLLAYLPCGIAGAKLVSRSRLPTAAVDTMPVA
jgi:hypothetical protein